MNIDKILESYSLIGCSSYLPKMLLKVILYGYVKKRFSSRLIADVVQSDVKFIWLVGRNKPTRNVINSFRKDKMMVIMEDVFTELLSVLERKGYINTEEYFVDGTKEEANANKYSFVWKKTVSSNREKLEAKVRGLMREIDVLNVEETELFPEGEEKPKEITPEELDEYARRLSEKLNESLEKR